MGCLHKRYEITDYDDCDIGVDFVECLDCGEEFKVFDDLKTAKEYPKGYHNYYFDENMVIKRL